MLEIDDSRELCKLLEIETKPYENCSQCSDYRKDVDACFYSGGCDGRDYYSTDKIILDDFYTYHNIGYKIEVPVEFEDPYNFINLLKIVILIETDFIFMLSEKTPQKYLVSYLLSKVSSSEKRLNAYRAEVKKVNWRYNNV